MPRERPILFSGAMVRAIMEGRKTQTRRVMKPQPPSIDAVKEKSGSSFSIFTDRHAPGAFRVAGPVWAVRELMGHEPTWRCPYGQPGDRLWVRETWALEERGDDTKRIVWRADYRAQWRNRDGREMLGEEGHFFLPTNHVPGAWRPSIHMPRWASRLTLEVTEVRVQRLHEISEEDALEEGVALLGGRHCGEPSCVCALKGPAVTAFQGLWDSINAERPGCAWADNPWVWAVSFRVVR